MLVRLVVPQLLQQEFLHHYHTSLEGGHQGIEERINEFGITFSEEDSIGVPGVMWQNVLIARQENENLFFAANLREASKPLIRFR